MGFNSAFKGLSWLTATKSATDVKSPPTTTSN